MTRIEMACPAALATVAFSAKKVSTKPASKTRYLINPNQYFERNGHSMNKKEIMEFIKENITAGAESLKGISKNYIWP